jgi:outer membrane protein OmpA-like peptidoglycan-associated protein
MAFSGTVTAAFLLGACSLLPERHVDAVQDNPVPERAPPRKLVQLGFGRETSFGACIEPACPTVTRKTFVTMQAIATAPEPTAVRPIIEEAVLPASPATQAIPRALGDSSGIVAQTPRSSLILHFPFAATALTASDKAELDKLTPHASKAKRIVIVSRTDNVGSDRANQAVALARANVVRDYLRSKLSAPEQALLIDARGLCCFIASNDTPDGRRQNRRVEIVLSVPEQVAP